MVAHRFVLLTALAACDPGEAATPDSTLGVPVEGIPTDSQGMNGYLQRKAYSSWPKESAAHPSTGPHTARVLTFINPKLEASLKAGNGDHPSGSAAVKEFLDGSGNVTGWAAYVKAVSRSDGGSGWYWYETFDAAPGAAASSEGRGNRVCIGCHAQGRDFVRIPFPLH